MTIENKLRFKLQFLDLKSGGKNVKYIIKYN